MNRYIIDDSGNTISFEYKEGNSYIVENISAFGKRKYPLYDSAYVFRWEELFGTVGEAKSNFIERKKLMLDLEEKNLELVKLRIKKLKKEIEHGAS